MLLAAKLAVSCLVLWFNASFRNKLLPKKKKKKRRFRNMWDSIVFHMDFHLKVTF